MDQTKLQILILMLTRGTEAQRQEAIKLIGRGNALLILARAGAVL